MKSLDKILGLKIDILLKINNVKDINELNDLRSEVAKYMTEYSDNKEDFREVQLAFINKNKKLRMKI